MLLIHSPMLQVMLRLQAVLLAILCFFGPVHFVAATMADTCPSLKKGRELYARKFHTPGRTDRVWFWAASPPESSSCNAVRYRTLKVRYGETCSGTVADTYTEWHSGHNSDYPPDREHCTENTNFMNEYVFCLKCWQGPD